jgi:hypothetical protein
VVAAGSSETSVTTYETAPWHSPEDNDLPVILKCLTEWGDERTGRRINTCCLQPSVILTILCKVYSLCSWCVVFSHPQTTNSVAWVRRREIYRPSDRRLSAKLVPITLASCSREAIYENGNVILHDQAVTVEVCQNHIILFNFRKASFENPMSVSNYSGTGGH